MVMYEDLEHIQGLPPCDYIMLTNGDNIYSTNLIPVILPLMRDRMDLIGYT